MKPARFHYVKATSVPHALEQLDEETKLIAGGQSLLPIMNLRMATPERLVDIDALHELDRVVVAGSELLIGALARHDRLVRDPQVSREAPLLAAAARHIGHVAIRNRGTLGGSLAHADPTAELPAATVALRASIICDRADGRRRELPAEDFFQGRYTTALEPDEMVTWVRLPLSKVTGWGFHEVAPREGDFAWAGACVVRETAPDALRVVVFGVESIPRRFDLDLPVVEDHLAWSRELAQGLEPTEDPAFRRDLATEMIRRATLAAVEGGHGRG